MWISEEVRALLSPFSIYFNGIDLTDYFIPKQDTGRGLPAREIGIMTVPGKDGGRVTTKNTPVRYITQEILVACESAEELRKKLEHITKILHTDEAVPLTFADESDRTYYAIFGGAVEGYEIDGFYTATLTFICEDPLKYGNSKVDNFVGGAATVSNGGTAPAKPIFEFDVLDDITNLDVFTEDAYMRVGEPAPIDEPVYQRMTPILNDSLKTLLPWSVAPSVDNGYVAGAMKATQAGIEVENFGTALSPQKWQGPVIRRSLGTPIQNFRMDIEVEMLNVKNKLGMIEIYLLDALSNTVAKVGIEDIWRTINKNQTKFQLGNLAGRKVQYYRQADYPPAWNDFVGTIRLHRDGNRFRPYFALVRKDGKHVWVSGAYLYTDKVGEYAAPIAQVQIGIRKFPGTDEATMRLRNLKVWRYNDRVEGIPSIATAGDKIVIDTNDNSIRLNGEERKDLKDFGATFFKLPEGSTTVLMQPYDKVSGKVIYREPFL